MHYRSQFFEIALESHQLRWSWLDPETHETRFGSFWCCDSDTQICREMQLPKAFTDPARAGQVCSLWLTALREVTEQMAASGTALPAEAWALFTETIMQKHQLPVTPSKAQFYFLRDARENTRNCALIWERRNNWKTSSLGDKLSEVRF